MIAALPMYDPPWLREANDAFWRRLSDRLGRRGIAERPAALHRGADLVATWTSPSLLLGQTCGYPLITRLRELVRLVATPHYRAAGCDGPYHRAAIIVRRSDAAATLEDLRGRRAGVNGWDSNSGMNLFRHAICQVASGSRFFESVAVTGSHARSAASVLTGRIDVASIDAVTLALLRDRYPAQAGQLRVLTWTAACPALPLIASREVSDASVEILREELDAMARTPEIPEPLRISGFEVLSFAEYECILEIEDYAVTRGYPHLA